MTPQLERSCQLRRKSIVSAQIGVRANRVHHQPQRSGKEQIVFYQSGVGSEADFSGEGVSGTSVLRKALQDLYIGEPH